MDKIVKFMDVEVKKAEEPRTFNFIASTEDRDRYGDVVVQSGWKLNHFKKNPVIMWAHKYLEPPIGRALETKIEDGKLKIKVQFVPEDIHPFAEKIRKLVEGKWLRTVSVGFMTYKTEDLNDEDKKKRTDLLYGKRLFGELLEVSIAPVPANPMALAEKAFNEVLSTGSTHEEKKIDILPYEKDGKFDGNLLMASFGALFGARGGVTVPGDQKKSIYNHLAHVAIDNGVTPPAFKNYSEKELRDSFKDVWHDELLDVVQNGLDEEVSGTVNLIKGNTRNELILTRDSLTRLIDLSEEKALIQPINKDDGSDQVVEKIIKDLAAVKSALK